MKRIKKEALTLPDPLPSIRNSKKSTFCCGFQKALRPPISPNTPLAALMRAESTIHAKRKFRVVDRVVLDNPFVPLVVVP